MQRKLALPLALFFIMLIIFAGCAHEIPQKKQIKSFYEEFIEVDLLDPVRAIEEYEHYNDETLKAVAIDSVKGNYTTHNEILSLEKITDQLWVIELYIETRMNPEGFNVYHFVGEINGTYKVMRSVRSIPQVLIGDLNLDAYLPTGDFIDPEDVMIDIPIKREN